jgi:hypothetical protein
VSSSLPLHEAASSIHAQAKLGHEKCGWNRGFPGLRKALHRGCIGKFEIAESGEGFEAFFFLGYEVNLLEISSA